MATAKPPLDLSLWSLACAVVLVIFSLSSKLSEERRKSRAKDGVLQAKDAEIKKLQSKLEHYEEQLEKLVRSKK